MRWFFLFAFVFITLVFVPIIYSRVTPEDILNSQKTTYNQKLKNYSLENQKKLAEFDAKIAELNKKQTGILEEQMERQGEILNEFVSRKKIDERQADGIHRNLEDPIENARYWLTYAHEAVAYQAAKVYVFNLSSQSNIKNDVNAQINQLNSDMNILIGKVEKSRKIVAEVVLKE